MLLGALRREAVEAGNLKAAKARLAEAIGVRPAALDTLLYQRRAGRRLVRRLRRAWVAALARSLRRDMEALADAAGDGDVDAARLVSDMAGALAALEARLAAMEETE